MGAYCRHCHGLLTRDEFFWFDNSCMLCEQYRQTGADERQLLVKSPLFAFRMLSFHSRRIRHLLSGFLRSINIV